MNQNDPRRATSLSEQAYIRLREMIITCELAPGIDIKEPELAQRLHMSKTPVREAMGRLCLEGFLQTFPRKGYRVAPVTIKDVNDLFAVRSILESAATKLAADNLSNEHLDRLAALANVQYVVGEDTSATSFVSSNLAFHTMIAQGSNNLRLATLILRHLEEGTRFLYLGIRARDVNLETNHDHQKIVAALLQRNAENAAKEMATHIENTRIGLLQGLINQNENQVSF